MLEIRQLRRSALAKEEKRRLFKEDEREDHELRGYVIRALTAGIECLMEQSTGDEVKVPLRDVETAPAWSQTQENGEGRYPPPRPP